jgi:NAD(P)-dependent dehydrogenase (short-subunit alcohol dehydrogenase family)
MTGQLDGKTLLVTGGSRGIGADIVKTAIRDGARVVLQYASNQQAAEAIQAACGGETCFLVQADLSEPNGARMLWQNAMQLAGEIDVLVNNAAISPEADPDGDFAQWDEVWAKIAQTNIKAPADLTRLAVQHFKTRSGGRIINIASRAGHRGDTTAHIFYGASKAALLAMTKTIARFEAKHNVLAFAIAPGFIATEKAQQWVDTYGINMAVGDNPLGAMGTPAEIAELVVFLASDKTRSTNGATFDVNGGSYVR